MVIRRGFYLVVLVLLACCVTLTVGHEYCNSLGNGDHPHPFWCSQYISCENGLTLVKGCMSGFVFDPDVKACVDKSIAHPCHTVTTAVPVPAVNQDYCRLHGLVNGNYRHPVTCNQFIACHYGNTYLTTCVDELLFDANSHTCLFGSLAVMCSNQVATVIPGISDLETVCESYKLPEGIYPHPYKCEFFVECLDGFTIIVKCPEGLQYNRSSSSCSHPSTVNCSNNYAYAFKMSQ